MSAAKKKKRVNPYPSKDAVFFEKIIFLSLLILMLFVTNYLSLLLILKLPNVKLLAFAEEINMTTWHTCCQNGCQDRH